MPETTRGRGRPPAIGDEVRGARRIYVRLSEPQRAAAAAAARQAGLPLAEWVARLVIAAAPPTR